MGTFLEAIQHTADDLIDTDDDGAYIDNIGGTVAQVGAALYGGGLGVGAGMLAPVGAGAGAAAGGPAIGGMIGGAAASLLSEADAAGNAWGDGMSDLLGTRDMSAENADEHGQGVGAWIREANDPGMAGDIGGVLGMGGGAIIGGLAGLPAGPVGPIVGAGVGATTGAVLGQTAGSRIDHQIEAFRHWMD